MVLKRETVVGGDENLSKIVWRHLWTTPKQNASKSLESKYFHVFSAQREEKSECYWSRCKKCTEKKQMELCEIIKSGPKKLNEVKGCVSVSMLVCARERVCAWICIYVRVQMCVWVWWEMFGYKIFFVLCPLHLLNISKWATHSGLLLLLLLLSIEKWKYFWRPVEAVG